MERYSVANKDPIGNESGGTLQAGMIGKIVFSNV